MSGMFFETQCSLVVVAATAAVLFMRNHEIMPVMHTNDNAFTVMLIIN